MSTVKLPGRWRPALFVAACLFFLLLPGCAVFTGPALAPQREYPDRVLLDDVPFFAQDRLQCGPAALAMALSWSGLETRPEELLATAYLPDRQGSLQADLVTAARRRGRLAYPIHGLDELFAELAAGSPVIVLVNLGFSWYPKWHYAVVKGYDLADRTITLHSGAVANERLSLRRFDNLWQRGKRWGLLVLPPGKLPLTASEERFLDAAVGLERAGRWQAAAAAYRTALARWPASLAAAIGLGNSRYASGDLAGAEAVLRHAVAAHRQSGVAWNNLAEVLARQGKRQEALAAARQAVAIGGPLRSRFRETLETILGAP